MRQLLAVVADHPEDASAHYELMIGYRTQKKMPEAAAEKATFNRLQVEKAEMFQSKLNALLNNKKSAEEAPLK